MSFSKILKDNETETFLSRNRTLNPITWHPVIYCGKERPVSGAGEDDVAHAGSDKSFSKAKGLQKETKPFRLPDSNPDRIAPTDVEPEVQ